MKRKSRGQSLVEFAMVFPLLMAAFFSAIDGGYFIYGWAQVQFAARRGAEQASKLPPREVYTTPVTYQGVSDDPCLQLIRDEINRNGAFSESVRIKGGEIYISFHKDVDEPDAQGGDLRRPGMIIQVRIERALRPLTPIGDMVAPDTRGFMYNAVSRRTIVSTAPTIGSTPPMYRSCRS